jgi:hypothetical protein
MRSMLVRAAEIRDSEQQQIFDALDEIHARLAPLESLGSVRKRLSEMPPRCPALSSRSWTGWPSRSPSSANG